MSIIRVSHLSKEFKRQIRGEGFRASLQNLLHPKYEIKNAVNNVSFEIKKGEIVGYLGPNGAGKSTTIKMLAGILVPTSGEVEISGMIPHKNRQEYAKRIGVVFGQRTQLWWDIPVSESLNLMKYMYKIPDKKYREKLNIFVEYLDLQQFLHVPVRQLSLGQRMRADLCAALLHEPDILFLDEPTIGLDVVVKENIRKFIKEVNKETSNTVLLTTHDMSDIEKLCSRVMVIDQGKMMFDGKLDQLKKEYGSEELMIVETDSIVDVAELYQLGVSYVKQEKTKIIIKYDRRNLNSSIIIEWIIKHYRVTDFVVQQTEVEEVIRKLYKDVHPL